jgi:hypothetical protein
MNNFKKFIKTQYGSYANFSREIGVTVPTAHKYLKEPLTMTINTFVKISVQTNTPAVELFKTIKDSMK